MDKEYRPTIVTQKDRAGRPNKGSQPVIINVGQTPARQNTKSSVEDSTDRRSDTGERQLQPAHQRRDRKHSAQRNKAGKAAAKDARKENGTAADGVAVDVEAAFLLEAKEVFKTVRSLQIVVSSHAALYTVTALIRIK